MKSATQQHPAVVRRPKMEPATVMLDAARARVIASKGPSLNELCAKLGNWNCPEVSGQLRK